MEPTFWHERWRSGDIGFHQPDIHALLQTHWPRLGVPRQSKIFVPLCGKSLDMAWLAEQGHAVVGAELSEIAVDEFFAERGLQPTVRSAGPFAVKSAGPYELWCGDVFELPSDAVAGIAGVYDRAALVAFPPALQEPYAKKLRALVPAAPILLMTLDYDTAEMTGPPFPVPPDRVDRLFADHYAITELESREAIDTSPGLRKRGLTSITEWALLLQRA